MLDALLSLAVSMQANPGVYALLLGSGVSRASGMPTGWDIVLDLLNKLATLENEDPGPDPEAWYSKKYGSLPTYSGLLEAVAKSQAERSQLLSAYFEPSEAEREESRKLPTKAHRAITDLVKMRVIRVIITTNFDRLIETSLEAEGITPTVIRSADDVDGAKPLVHSQCTVIKIHGDYLDLRTRNTSTELEAYDERLDKLLDRVFDEFGLIVSGWSAEWDRALCNAVRRAKGRRFTTYWTKIGPLTDAAQHLIEQRGAQVIEVKGADEFFETLAEKVHALVSMKTAHPLSVQAAIAQTKRYLPESKHAIRLHDLIMDEVEQVIEKTNPVHYPVGSQLSDDDFIKRVNDFEAISLIAASIIATGCFHGGAEHQPLWVKALDRLCNPGNDLGGNVISLGLMLYPAVLLQYAAGVSAAASGRLTTLHAILTQPRVHKEKSYGYLPMDLWHAVPQDIFKKIPSLSEQALARTGEIFRFLREPLRISIPSDSEYTKAFDTFETLQSLEAAENLPWPIPGQFMYRYYYLRGGKTLLKRDGSPLLALKAEVLKSKENAAVLKAGFLQGSVAQWDKAVRIIDERSEKYG